ncbi:MAG TPA: hypothetical protein VG755_34675 [Nannocystaceae bacterium]|nr:hypothetical protein [Nannocystaceae bacterium]
MLARLLLWRDDVRPAESGAWAATKRCSLLLIIEDLRLGEEILALATELGHVCELRRQRHEARESLLRGGFEAVIVDLERSASDGISLLATVRRFGDDVWIVALLPAHVHPEPTMAYDVALSKPLSAEAVLASLARMPS